MFNGSKLTAVIPARMGSKGIPSKNRYKIKGFTLVEIGIKLALTDKRIDKIIVSSNDPEILSLQDSYGDICFDQRPDHLATDDAKTVDVLRDLVLKRSIQGYILLLQPTTPLRSPEDLKGFLTNIEEASADFNSSVCLSPLLGTHPDKVQVINNGEVDSYLGKNSQVPRQELREVYSINGAFYLSPIDHLLNENTLLPKKVLPYVIPSERGVNLDSKLDLVLMETLIQRNIVDLNWI